MKSFFLIILSAISVCLLSCQANQNERDSYNEAADSTSDKTTANDPVKLVKTGDLSFKLTDVQKGVRRVAEITNGYGGMLMYQAIDAAEQNKKLLPLSNDSLLQISTTVPTAEIRARVPSEHLEAFMFAIMDIGYSVNNSRLQIDDKSLEFLQNRLKQTARESVIGRKQKTDTNRLQNLALRDESIDQAIANKRIDADVAFSTIHLQLFQNPLVRKEMVVNTDIDHFQLSFSERLRQAFSNGWHVFLNLLLVVANLWAVLLAAMLAYTGYRYWLHKKARPSASV